MIIPYLVSFSMERRAYDISTKKNIFSPRSMSSGMSIIFLRIVGKILYFSNMIHYVVCYAV